MIDWLTDWSIDRLIDWLIDWLIEWLTDWLTDWLISSHLATASPSFINRDTFPNYFFVGDANDPNVQASIKTQFLALLKSPFIPPPFCQTHKECTIDNISVYTGAKGKLFFTY